MEFRPAGWCGRRRRHGDGGGSPRSSCRPEAPQSHCYVCTVVNEPVEIWVVPLDPPERELLRLHALLSGEERRRAGAPPFSPRKRRYVARQGALREILARYAAVTPERLQLVRSNRGKPILPGGGPHFSVSDSGDLALVAVARREVGVDVERVRRRAASERAAIGT